MLAVLDSPRRLAVMGFSEMASPPAKPHGCNDGEESSGSSQFAPGSDNLTLSTPHPSLPSIPKRGSLRPSILLPCSSDWPRFPRFPCSLIRLPFLQRVDAGQSSCTTSGKAMRIALSIACRLTQLTSQPAPVPAYVLLVRVIRHWQTHSTFSSSPLLCALVLLFRHSCKHCHPGRRLCQNL